MLKGTVKQVFPYPVSPNEYYMQKIPSNALKSYFLNPEVPTILVIIQPLFDPNTPSALAWTSKQGPPVPLHPSAVGTSRVTVDRIRPIAYVIPSLGK
jgi:hypothetical protein